ncbi:MAG: hypothetical protein ABI572_01885 [Actinomycetota bacterium]
MQTRLRGETGMMGKLVIVWLLLLALTCVAAVDTLSIMFTTFHVADAAARAASSGVDAYARTGSAPSACEEAATAIRAEDDTIKIPKKGFCTVDPQTGRVTITVKKTAHTFLAGHLSFTKHYAQVVHTETAGPSSV